MRFLGFNYNTDLEPFPSIEAIKQNLQLAKNMNANSVRIIGSDLEKTKFAAEAAASLGLNIWLAPRKLNANPKEFEKFLREFAAMAEEIRKKFPASKIVFSVGNKITLELRGFLEGKTYQERHPILEAFLKFTGGSSTEMKSFPRVFKAGRDYENRLNRKLNSALTKFVRAAKSKFKGEISYSKGFWEKVKWNRFDFAAGNFYLSSWNRGILSEVLRRELKASRKPAVLTEFGTASFRGASDLGRDAELHLKEHPSTQYDEDSQIVGISEQLKAIGSAELDGCFVWQFFEPDLRGFGITRPLKDGFVEPKRSAGIISEFYSNWASRSGQKIDAEKVHAKILEQFARR